MNILKKLTIIAILFSTMITQGSSSIQMINKTFQAVIGLALSKGGIQVITWGIQHSLNQNASSRQAPYNGCIGITGGSLMASMGFYLLYKNIKNVTLKDLGFKGYYFSI